MLITRRQFLKYCSVAAGALGLTATDLMKLEKALAKEDGVQVVWLMGATCTGCSTSLLNSVYYSTIQELLLSGPALGTLDLQYHPTVMAAAGDLATTAALTGNLASTYVLVVEGSIQTGTPDGGSEGDYCHVGDLTGGPKMMDVVNAYAQNAAYILAVGTCAAFGGIPAANGSVTGAKGVLDFFDWKYMGPSLPSSGPYYSDETLAIRNKLVNIPGCPPNPNWIVGTIAYILAHFNDPIRLPALDSLRRPRMYYGERLCNNCDRFVDTLGEEDGFFFSGSTSATSGTHGPSGYFINNTAPLQIGDPAKNKPYGLCLKYIGCKGSRTKADCSYRKWHSPGFSEQGVNWCVGAGAPCQGCTQDGFPDRMSPFHHIR